jgi:hypothetical protein
MVAGGERSEALRPAAGRPFARWTLRDERRELDLMVHRPKSSSAVNPHGAV